MNSRFLTSDHLIMAYEPCCRNLVEYILHVGEDKPIPLLLYVKR